MMKKLISLVLVMGILFCFAACEANEDNDDDLRSTKSKVNSVYEDDDRTDDADTTQQATHKHKYSEATCSSPKTCTECGEIVGSVLEHNYVNNVCTYCGGTDPDSLPVGLDKLFVIDSEYYKYQPGSFTDSFGNVYDGVHLFEGLEYVNYGAETHSTINLKMVYKSFSGSIVATTKTEPKMTYYVHIYVDDVLKFSKTGITKTTGKVDFNVDVTGGEVLKITAGSEFRYFGGAEELGIVNAKLTK